ncbi:TIGR04255 family protein [Pendulispora rubella]|uniref:TIGR04255 family protein n=1 Tax=Pendulispora rubella TaxID=2741070 RepID=A0ABZ2LB74_9BACT
MIVDFDPFAMTEPDEVPLERAPLTRVIAQVRFPTLTSLGRADFIIPFQERIRERYPILHPEHGAGFLLGPAGVTIQKNDVTIWRFQSTANDWRVSLAPDFVALESTAYKDRDDFFERLEHIVTALEVVVNPVISDRLGLRYINRIRGPEFERLGTMIRREILGIGATTIAGRVYSVCESVFTQGTVSLHTRWGLVPPGATTDPTSVEPIGEPSWILDLDMSRAEQVRFDVRGIVADGRSFAKTIHNFFRWSVTPDFLKAYGGKP